MPTTSGNHQFLRYVPTSANSRAVRDVALALMNFYFRKDWSRTKWTKVKSAKMGCLEGSDDPGSQSPRKEWDSIPFVLADLERHLERGSFDHKAFQLFAPKSRWLDEGIDMCTDAHVADEFGNVAKVQLPLQSLGPRFPLVPELDREGWAVSSFQRLSHLRILRLHRTIVTESHNFMSIEWLEDVRSYVCECISLIDMILHQLYLKAEHAPEPGWKFDPIQLGVRHGRRVADKLRWVRQITGRSLEDARDELREFHPLRSVRNHVQHFDPPSFACSLEGDATRWLNACTRVARLAWKIRERVGAPLTEELVSLLLLPAVEFVPQDPLLARAPLTDDAGYASSCWGPSANETT